MTTLGQTAFAAPAAHAQPPQGVQGVEPEERRHRPDGELRKHQDQGQEGGQHQHGGPDPQGHSHGGLGQVVGQALTAAEGVEVEQAERHHHRQSRRDVNAGLGPAHDEGPQGAGAEPQTVYALEGPGEGLAVQPTPGGTEPLWPHGAAAVLRGRGLRRGQGVIMPCGEVRLVQDGRPRLRRRGGLQPVVTSGKANKVGHSAQGTLQAPAHYGLRL